MTNICFCDHHTDMIKKATMDDLMEISNHQINFMTQLDELIKGLDDPFWDIAQLFMDSHNRPMSEIVVDFKQARDNASKIFDFVQEEIKKRLDVPPSHRNVPLATLHAKE